MRTKKILAMLSALAMMGSLAACGGESGTSTADSSSKAETTAAADTSEADTTTTAPAAETTEAPSTTAEPIPEPDAKAITFDGTSLYTAEAVMDAGAAPIELSIAEVNGNKKLLVHVLLEDGAEEYAVPKIKFDLDALLGAENVGKIGHISADFYNNALETWKNDDGSESLVVGNFLGAFGGNIAAEKAYDAEGNLIQNTWANHYEFACDDWENPTHEWRIETDIPALLPANGYASLDGEYYDADGNPLDAAEVCEGRNLFIMRWGQKNSVDFYIDNLTFFDKDGNAMDVIYDPSADTGASEGETTDAPAEEEAAEETTTAAAE